MKNNNIIKNIQEKKNYLLVVFLIIGVVILRSIILRKPDDQLTYVLEKGTLSETVKVTGVYTTASKTEVFSSSDGIIKELYVTNNQDIQKDDPLFYIESTATTEQKATAYANYQLALTALKASKQNKENLDAKMWTEQKALLDAENNLEFMNDKLRKDDNNPATGEKYTTLEIQSIKSAVSQTHKDFEAVEKQYKESDQNISSSQAVFTAAKLAYDATKSIVIKSPANGKIVNLLKKTGDEVKSLSPTTSAPVLLVANLGNPSIIAKINEVDVSRIIEGQKATIIFDSARQSTFTGSVEIIDMVGTDNNGVITYDARINLEGIPDNIRPNMTGVITIETFRKDDIFFIPNTAIIYQDSKTFIQKSGKNLELIEVNLGYIGLIKTEIINDSVSNQELEGLEISANVQSNL